MSAIYAQPIVDPAAWKGPEMEQATDWIHTFDDAEVAEIDAALRTVQAKGLSLPEIGRENFLLPTVGPLLESYIREVEVGRGFVLLRGFPAERYDDEQVGIVFWGMGCYMGLPVRQNPRGELLGHVKDYGRKFGEMDVRGYETNAHLPFHTDGCDIVGLMCLRRAKAGGESSVVSSLTLHNEVLRNHPEYLPVFYRGFYYIRREAANTDTPVTPYRVPLFGQVNGVVSARYVGAQVRAAATKMGQPLSDLENEALAYLDELAKNPAIHLDMDLKVGDIQLCNNYTMMHSRTDFQDYPEVERRRHMLRLWLTSRNRRPLAEDFPQHNGYGLGQIAEVAFSEA